ncbi:hypothetical protein ACFXPS_40210 [Nocardia sp. NPDC059091]|uniref:hypothetical protein n=1 Tax=unclassified Nocardia TaxID=2637762 RepID=UPI0036C1781F
MDSDGHREPLRRRVDLRFLRDTRAQLITGVAMPSGTAPPNATPTSGGGARCRLPGSGRSGNT